MPTSPPPPEDRSDPAKPSGRERPADEQRTHGPRYHGDAWETADEGEEEEPSFDDEAPPEPRTP